MPDLLFNVNWTMDKGRSLFSTAWSPDTETRLYEETDNGYKLTVSGTRGGNRYSWHYAAQYDGRDHRVHGRPDADAVEVYRINDRITVGFFKKNGVFAGPYSRHLSADGGTLTVQAVGRQPDGTAYFDVLHYRKPVK